MRIMMVIFLTMVPASFTFAGCAEVEANCYHYKAGQLIDSGNCQIVTCANATSFYNNWDWRGKADVFASEDKLTVNGKAGYALPFIFKDENLQCVGIVGDDDIICNDSGNF